MLNQLLKHVRCFQVQRLFERHLFFPIRSKSRQKRLTAQRLFTHEFMSSEYVRKTYFGSLKLSHCNLKLLHCNSTAVFFLYFNLSNSHTVVTIKLLNNIKFQNILKKLYFVCEKLLVENHGERRCINFAKQECRKWSMLVIFSKTQFDFWCGILQQKKTHFSFYERFIENFF